MKGPNLLSMPIVADSLRLPYHVEKDGAEKSISKGKLKANMGSSMEKKKLGKSKVVGTWNWLETIRSEASYIFEAVRLRKKLQTSECSRHVSVQWALKHPSSKNGLWKLGLLWERQTPQHLLQMWSKKIQTGISLPEDRTRSHKPMSFSKIAELGLIKKLPYLVGWLSG